MADYCSPGDLPCIQTPRSWRELLRAELPHGALSPAGTGTLHSWGRCTARVNGAGCLGQDWVVPPAPGCPWGGTWHSPAALTSSTCPAGGDPGIAEGSGPLRRQLPADTGAGRHVPVLPRRVGSVLPGVCYHAVSHRLTSPRCPSVPTAASCLTDIPGKVTGKPRRGEGEGEPRAQEGNPLLPASDCSCL